MVPTTVGGSALPQIHYNTTALSSAAHNLGVQELSVSFHVFCTCAFDLAPPLRMRFKTHPWLNESVRAIRKERRRGEHSWRKDKLQVSLEISLLFFFVHA